MDIICPHCSQSIEIDPETSPFFDCPCCGGSVPVCGNAADTGDLTPSQGVGLDPCMEDRPSALGSASGDYRTARSTAVARSLLQTFQGLNRNVRILGGVALLVLGGLAIFIASRNIGNILNNRQTIHNRIIKNEYFTKLISSGVTSAESLARVEGLLPYQNGFIGVSLEKLSWGAAQDLADQTGAEVLDIAVTAHDRRREFTGWLAGSFTSEHGRTIWIRDNAVTKVMDIPDVLNMTNRAQLRKVFLHWPRSEGWSGKGWSWSIPAQYDEVTAFSEGGLARVRSGPLWGIIDETGKAVQKAAFDLIEPFAEQGSARVSQGSQWGLLDRTGKLVAKPEWEDIQHFINGYIPVQKAGKWGYLDATGKLAIPCIWDDAWRFSPEGYAVVTRGDLRGFIDRSGKVIVEPVWDGAINFSKEGIGAVRRGEGWGLMDTSGNLLCEPKWQISWKDRRFDRGFLPCRGFGENAELGVAGGASSPFEETPVPAKQWQEGLLGMDGKLLAGAQNEQHTTSAPRAYMEGLSPSEEGGKWGFIDQSGKVVVKQEWDEVTVFREGRAAVKRGDLWGFVDDAGKIAAEPKWREVGGFTDGLAAILTDPTTPPPNVRAVYKRSWTQENSIWGFIDRTGKIRQVKENWTFETARIQSGFGSITSEFNILTTDGHFEYLSQKGEWTRSYPFQLSLGESFLAGDYLNRYGKTGCTNLIDKNKLVVIPGVEITLDSNWMNDSWKSDKLNFMTDFIPYATPQKYGLIDLTGKILVQPVWDEARIVSPEWIWIRTANKCGLADKEGKIVIQPVWDELEVLPVDSGSLGADGRSVLVGNVGDEILSPWVRAKDGAKSTILRLNGQPAIPDNLVGAEYVDFYGPAHLVITQSSGPDGKIWSVYEPGTGKQINFPLARTFRWNWNTADAGVLWLQDKTTAEWRLMTREGMDSGHSQPEAERPDGWGFVEGRGRLHKSDGWTFVDTTVKSISAERWEDARDFSEGRAAVRRSGKWGFIAPDGQWLIPCVWDEVQDFSRGLAAVRRMGLWGYIDLNGKLVIEPAWDAAGKFTSWPGEPAPDGQKPMMDIAEVTIYGSAAVIDRNGGLVVDPQLPRIEKQGNALRNGKDQLIVMRKGDSVVLVPRSWNSGSEEEVSPARAWQMSVAGLPESEPGWSLVDETGKALGPAVWSRPPCGAADDPFAVGLFLAGTKDEKFCLIRRDGTAAMTQHFERIAWIAPKVAAVWSRDAGGLIDAAGSWIFHDNKNVRIARFDGKNSRIPERQHRRGLVLIEDVPKWGYARLNR